MVQSAARKSHILKVGVRSSLVCLSRQYILEAKNQRQPKDARKIARQLLLRNAASTYKAPKTPLMDHKGDIGNGAAGSAQVSILRSWVRSSLVALFVTVIQAGGEKQEPTKSSTKDSLTTVLFRNAASTYKAPITSLIHLNGDSYNGAVGSA